MKIIQKHTFNKKIFLITSIIAILLAGLLFYFYSTKCIGFHCNSRIQGITRTTPDLNPPANDQLKNGQQIKNNGIKNNKSTGGGDQPPAPSTQKNGKSIVEVAITSANQTDSSLQVRTLISTLDNTGTCTLGLVNQAGASLSYSTGVQPLSNTSTCKGFDIPLTDLSPGIWKISVVYENPTLTGMATKSTTIK